MDACPSATEYATFVVLDSNGKSIWFETSPFLWVIIGEGKLCVNGKEEK